MVAAIAALLCILITLFIKAFTIISLNNLKNKLHVAQIEATKAERKLEVATEKKQRAERSQEAAKVLLGRFKQRRDQLEKDMTELEERIASTQQEEEEE